VTSLGIAYVGEQWRSDSTGSTIDKLDFQFSTDATSLATGTWTDANVLDFSGPQPSAATGALDGNAAANRTALNSTITSLNIGNGATFWIRWVSINPTGSDDGLAIDDFFITPNPADSAPTVLSTTPTNGATNVAINSDVGINFSEAVNVSTASFTITCATSGAHTFALAGSSGAYTLNPNSDFVNNENCTVTVVAAQVTDQDSADPPDFMAADYSFSFTTAAAITCGAGFTPIYTIQGSGAASPIVSTTVTTEGVVIGDFQGSNNLSGFYIQDVAGDGNTTTSDGIFVLDGAAPAVNVAAGDRVRVSGTVAETFNLTQINAVTSVGICSTGNSLPSPVAYDLPESTNNDLERVENMLVIFPETLTVTGNFDLGHFGELTLSSEGRLFQRNSFDRPGTAGSLAVANLNARRYVLLDDGKSGTYPDPNPYFNAIPTRRVGDTTTGLTGVLTYDFNEYRVQPTGTVTFADANPRPAAPTTVGNVKAVGMNVLNYFNTFGNGNCTGGPGGSPMDCRGANSAAEFTRQRDKIIASIIAMNPDVIGMSEMENDGVGPGSAIQDLVNGLNAAVTPGTYAFVTEPGPGTDAIKVSIIYKPGVLSLAGAAVNDSNPVHNRPPLAQTFQLVSNGERFNFIVNHFKSKGGTCPGSGSDADAGDGQGCFNGTRVSQANALLSFIQARKAASGDADVLSVGDYNSYGEEDPMFTMEQDGSDVLADGAGGLISQTKRYIAAANRYSYQFADESGELDHALATKSMDQQTTGAFIWHNNADEPVYLDYNIENKSAGQQALNVGTVYRTSDHDPVVIGLLLSPPTVADGRITGRIADVNGVAVAGAVVNLSGTQNRKTITDENGNYSFANVETTGFYTVRATRANYSFSPQERSFSQLGNQTEAAFTATATSTTTSNPVDTAEYFVRQHYLDFLGREPEESGFNFWSDQILGCGSDAACAEVKRINVSAAYFLSIEFQETGGLVDGLYRASFERAPRYAEFMPDSATIGKDVIVGGAGWEQQLAANRQAFLDAFVQRPAFQSVYGGSSNEQYVDQLLAHTGVSWSQGERDALVDSLSNGTLTKAAVLGQVAGDQRFVAAKRNQTFVIMEYFGYLRRDPDAAGYEFWLNKLNQFNGNFEQAEMVKAFIVSGEYRGRFPR
jgi:predicted extracellular nuclease